MTTSDVLRRLMRNRNFVIGLACFGILAIAVAASFPAYDLSLNRSRMNANQALVAAGAQIRDYDKAKTLAYEGRIRRVQMASMSSALVSPAADKFEPDATPDRKIVRISSMDLVVRTPGEVAEKVRALAEGMGGFLVSSEMTGGDGASGSLTVRVPAARFEEARAEIRKLGLRVESEKIEAQDVTRQYVDDEASLRNLRAEETQYLMILKQAHTVKETLDVSEKLSEVRGQIDQEQAEFETLSKQVETVAIAVSLRAEAEAQVFGLHWRPLYQMKLALRDGLDAIGSYAASMISVAFYLPAILLWVVTLVLGGAVVWKISRWGARVFIGWPKKAVEQSS